MAVYGGLNTPVDLCRSVCKCTYYWAIAACITEKYVSLVMMSLSVLNFNQFCLNLVLSSLDEDCFQLRSNGETRIFQCTTYGIWNQALPVACIGGTRRRPGRATSWFVHLSLVTIAARRTCATTSWERSNDREKRRAASIIRRRADFRWLWKMAPYIPLPFFTLIASYEIGPGATWIVSPWSREFPLFNACFASCQ